MYDFEEKEFSIDYLLLNRKQEEHKLSAYQMVDALQVSPYEFKLILSGQKPINERQINTLVDMLKVTKKELLMQPKKTDEVVEKKEDSILDLLNDVQIHN